MSALGFGVAVPGTCVRETHPTDRTQKSAARPPSSAFLAMSAHSTSDEGRRQQPGEQEHADPQEVRRMVVPCCAGKPSVLASFKTFFAVGIVGGVAASATFVSHAVQVTTDPPPLAECCTG